MIILNNMKTTTKIKREREGERKRESENALMRCQ